MTLRSTPGPDLRRWIRFARYLAEIERLRPAERTPENLVVLPRGWTPRTASPAPSSRSTRTRTQTLRPLLVLALEQTGGRGRLGRELVEPARASGVYATRVLGVDDPEALQTLPLLVGIGLCRALDPLLPVPCRLKWPNDLLVETPAERARSAAS